MLDKLPYMSKSRHLKRKFMHITIKILQVKNVSEAPSMLRNHKHATIETSTIQRGLNHSLSKKLINLLLNNGMMSCSHLDIKLPEVMEQGRLGPKLKMVTPNHIKQKPIGCNASPLAKKFEKHTSLKSCRCRWQGGWRSWRLWHIRSANPQGPLSPSLSKTGGNTATNRLLATWMSLIPILQVRPPSQRCPLDLAQTCHRSLLYCEMEPSPWSGLATPFRKKRLRQPTED